MLEQLATVFSGVASQLMLAALLAPSAFGLVALANTFTIFVVALQEGGAARILIQRQREHDLIAPTVFWMVVVLSSLCALATVGAAPLLALFYDEPELMPVLYISALRFPAGAMASIFRATLAIRAQWRIQAKVSIYIVVAMGAGQVALAALGAGVYALVVPPVIADIARASAFGWLAGRINLRRWSLSLMRQLLGSGAMLVGTDLALAVRSQGAYILLGIMATISETGVYFFSWNLGFMAARLLLAGMTPVFFSVLARVADDPDRLREIYRSGFYVLGAALILVIVLQASLAWPLYRVVLDPKWIDGADLFSILSLFHMLVLINGIVHQPMLATGRYRQILLWNLMAAPVQLAFYFAGLYLGGSLGLAISSVVVMALLCIGWHAVSYRALNIPAETAVPMWRAVASALPIPLMALAMQQLLPQGWVVDVATIVVVTVAGSSLFLVLMRTLWREAWDAAITQLAPLVMRRRANLV